MEKETWKQSSGKYETNVKKHEIDVSKEWNRLCKNINIPEIKTKPPDCIILEIVKNH